MATILPADSISIAWYGARCHCRCRHCLLENKGRQTYIPFTRAKAVVEKFLLWTQDENIGHIPLLFTVGYSCDFPELADYIGFGQQNNMPWAQFLPLNGIAFRDPAELLWFLSDAQRTGVNTIGLTFFGTAEPHDLWSGRRGEFEYLLRIAETASKCGLERHETIFMVDDGAKSLSTLISILDTIPGLVGRSVSPWDYRGFAKRLEHKRPTINSVRSLPEDVTKFINFDSYKPESDWVAWLSEGNTLEEKRNVLIHLSEHNIELVENMDCGDIIEQLWEERKHFDAKVPPLSQLACNYGHKWGRRLYRLRDLKWKWIDCYLAEHTDIETRARFSDLASCVM